MSAACIVMGREGISMAAIAQQISRNGNPYLHLSVKGIFVVACFLAWRPRL